MSELRQAGLLSAGEARASAIDVRYVRQFLERHISRPVCFMEEADNDNS